MKSTLLILLLLFCTAGTQSFAQEEKQKKNKELGVTTSNFGFTDINFAVVYKWGLDDRYWKLEGTTLSATATPPITPIDSGFQNSRNNSFAAGVRLAREKRKIINDRVTLFHGIRFGMNFGHNYSKDFNAQSSFTNERINAFITPSIGYGLGIMFNIGESLYLSGELNPSISYRVNYRFEEIKNTGPFPVNETKLEQIEHNISLGASQSALRLGLFYKFGS